MTGIEPVVLASLIAAGGAAASAGLQAGLKPGLPKIEQPTPPPEPPAPAEAPPMAPTEADIGQGISKRKQRDQRRFGLSQTVLAGAPKLGEPFSGVGATPRLGG